MNQIARENGDTSTQSRVVSDPTCADYIQLSPADRIAYFDGNESTATGVLFGCNALAAQDQDALAETTIQSMRKAYDDAVAAG